MAGSGGDGEQQDVAMPNAAAVRAARAHFVASLNQSGLKWDDVFAKALADPLLRGMRVSELLAAVPAIGKDGAAMVMTEIGIAPTRQIRGLTNRQQDELHAQLTAADDDLA
jgi:hypothetical protein